MVSEPSLVALIVALITGPAAAAIPGMIAAKRVKPNGQGTLPHMVERALLKLGEIQQEVQDLHGRMDEHSRDPDAHQS